MFDRLRKRKDKILTETKNEILDRETERLLNRFSNCDKLFCGFLALKSIRETETKRFCLYQSEKDFSVCLSKCFCSKKTDKLD